jgi:hypothetical protein
MQNRFNCTDAMAKGEGIKRGECEEVKKRSKVTVAMRTKKI